MSFEEHIRELCERIITCDSKEDAMKLAPQMRMLLHHRIERLRGEVVIWPTTDDELPESDPQQTKA